MEEIWLRLIGILGVVFLFGFAIFIHELGHFLSAKMFGVGVKKFAIGFGPKIWSVVRGGTEYSLRWIPVGGFVALKGMMEGMDEADEDASAKPAPEEGQPEQQGAENTKKKASVTEDLDALRGKHPLVRMSVFCAGVFMNYLTAIVFAAILLWYGIPKEVQLPNVIEEIQPKSSLHQLGWRSGDKIVKVDGKPVTNWEGIMKGIAAALTKSEEKAKAAKIPLKDAIAQTTLAMTVQRPGQTLDLKLPLGVMGDETDGPQFTPPLPARIAAVTPNSPADRAKLVSSSDGESPERKSLFPWRKTEFFPVRAGDKVLAIDEKPVHSWLDMQKILRANPDKQITLTVERGENSKKRILKLETVLEKKSPDSKEGQLGVILDLSDSTNRERKPLLEAILIAPMWTVQKTGDLVALQIDVIKRSSWRDTQRQLGGPVAMSVMAYRTAQKGLSDYLWLFIAISISLAILNVLPIPVLDGGYIAITFIEMIIRRPVPQKVLAPVLTFFMMLFMILIALIFFNDFRNWIFKF